MAQALIRRLDDETLADYRRLAKERGTSLEAELRDLIERNRPRRRLAPQEREELSLQLKAGQKRGSDSTAIIREAREQLAARGGG
jgi:plasmid stability protein